MPKLPKILADNFERGLIRWECLRMNSDFIKSYREHRPFGYIPADLLLNPEVTESNIKRLYLKSKDYLRPLRSFIKKLPVSEDISVRDAVQFINMLGNKDFFTSQSIFLSSQIIEKKKVEHRGSVPYKLTIAINLEYKKDEIKKALDSEIDEWFRVREYEGVANKERTTHYKTIRRYLTIYQLKNPIKKPKPTYEQLAEMLYCKAWEKNPESVVQQIKRDCRKAKQYIAGRYKDIG